MVRSLRRPKIALMVDLLMWGILIALILTGFLTTALVFFSCGVIFEFVVFSRLIRRSYEGQEPPEDEESGYYDDMEDQDNNLDESQVVNQLNEREAKEIKDALIKHDGSLSAVATELGIRRATLYRRIKMYKIDPFEHLLNKKE